MIRIHLPYVLALSETLEPLAKVQPKARLDAHIFDMWAAQSALQALLDGSIFSGALRSSRQLGIALLGSMKKLAEDTNWEREITPYEAYSVTNAYMQFKTALQAEMGTFPTYFVSQKGSFDTLTLLDLPQRIFPAALWDKVPEARFDVAEAGKALCYELPTAVGFHTFRALESVLRRYYTELTGGAAPPKSRNIMVYVYAMRKAKCGDEKILGVIEQISKLHRNPLIHPEVALSLDEAIAIMGIAHSAITAMLAALPVPPATTQTAVVNAPAPAAVLTANP